MQFEIRNMIDKYFHSYNARELKNASIALNHFLNEKGGINKLFVSIAGAMSTSGQGELLADKIYQKKIHAICTTGANLEEDLYRHYYGKLYEKTDWRSKTKLDDKAIYNAGKMRVTDTLIPLEAMLPVDEAIAEGWKNAGGSKFPHEYVFDAIPRLDNLVHPHERLGKSWVKAARDMGVPIFVPGWEDSTEGNSFASGVIQGTYSRSCMKTGIDYMVWLCHWYQCAVRNEAKVGFLQIGGGIAGDFSICAVPLLNEDLEQNVPKWGYFCQISDSITSFGSYSGAPPTEKITWGKLDVSTPSFMIESDATIVLPLLLGSV